MTQEIKQLSANVLVESAINRFHELFSGATYSDQDLELFVVGCNAGVEVLDAKIRNIMSREKKGFNHSIDLFYDNVSGKFVAKVFRGWFKRAMYFYGESSMECLVQIEQYYKNDGK